MSSPHHCCISPPPSTTFPLPRLHSSSFRRRQAARRAKVYWRCSPRCTLETVGPVFDPLGIQCKEQDSPLSSLFGVLSSPAFGSSSTRREKSSYNRGAAAAIEDSSIDIGDFFKGPLPGKFLKLLGYLILSWLGVYVPLGGVNREAFAGNLDLNSLLGTLDSFSGGGIGRLGICSLGIVPFINAQIMFQLLAQLYPKLQDLQRKEGEPGRKKVLEYTRYASVGFAIVQHRVGPNVRDIVDTWISVHNFHRGKNI